MADPGGAAGARPYRSRFFHFDIQIFRNVATSGVGAPYEVGAPPMGNPGSATEQDIDKQVNDSDTIGIYHLYEWREHLLYNTID